MIYGYWNRRCDRQNFFAILVHFLPFHPLTTWKIKTFWKIEKKQQLEYHENKNHFTHVHLKWQPYDAWFLRYGSQRTECFIILDHYLPFYPPNNLKTQNFEKMKKYLEILAFYTCTPQMATIWCVVPEIWITTDRRFCHFGPFFALLLPPSNNPNIFWKNKKKCLEIILYKCSKIHDHMVHCSWDMTCDGCSLYFSFWAIFCPFTPCPHPPTAPINDLKIENKGPGNIITLHMCTRNYDHMVRGSWDMVRDRRTDERTEKVTYRGASFSFISLQHLGNIHPAFILSYNPGQHFSDKL